MWAITAEGLGKRYAVQDGKPSGFWSALRHTFGAPSRDGEFWALRDVSFELKTGDRLGVIGPNGSGKSTLLKILSRVTAPTEGRASLRGRVASLLEVGTGFHPELTGRENVFLNGAILGMPKVDIAKAFDAIVHFSGVEKFIDTPVKHYSSGMHVRLAFSVAAQLEPEIIIIDEVLAVGDAAFQKQCQRQINEASKDGRTVILVSHSMHSITTICDQTILLRNGRVEKIGKAADVTAAYNAESEALNYYTASAVREYPDNASKVVIRRVAMVGEDGPQRIFAPGAPVSIEIDYEIKQPVSEAMLCCAVGRNGLYIFQSNDTDASPKLLGRREPGLYRAIMPIPSDILPPGLFTVYPSFAIGHYGADGHDACPDAVSFEIAKAGSDDRSAMIRLNPTWTTQQVNHEHQRN